MGPAASLELPANPLSARWLACWNIPSKFENGLTLKSCSCYRVAEHTGQPSSPSMASSTRMAASSTARECLNLVGSAMTTLYTTRARPVHRLLRWESELVCSVFFSTHNRPVSTQSGSRTPRDSKVTLLRRCSIDKGRDWMARPLPSTAAPLHNTQHFLRGTGVELDRRSGWVEKGGTRKSATSPTRWGGSVSMAWLTPPHGHETLAPRSSHSGA